MRLLLYELSDQGPHSMLFAILIEEKCDQGLYCASFWRHYSVFYNKTKFLVVQIFSMNTACLFNARFLH